MSARNSKGDSTAMGDHGPITTMHGAFWILEWNKMAFMTLAISIGAALACCMLLPAQGVRDEELARQLANSSTRRAAIGAILTSAGDKVPLLLSWAQTPPAGVDRLELYIGLADAFGELRTKEAIPFLIKYIRMPRSLGRPNIWLKSEEAIEGEFPAVHALIRIGFIASKALTKAPLRAADERLAAIFAVARIGDPDARGFLASALGEANLERYWAEEGIKRLGER
jgi:hypothetical protein